MSIDVKHFYNSMNLSERLKREFVRVAADHMTLSRRLEDAVKDRDASFHSDHEKRH